MPVGHFSGGSQKLQHIGTALGHHSQFGQISPGLLHGNHAAHQFGARRRFMEVVAGTHHCSPGGVGFFKSLAAPTPVMTPMNILEIAIRPTSLCMRLFGNVLGAFVIMELIKLVVPVFVPAVFSLYFDLFDGLIQTYVFVFLTSLFMKETMGGED